MELKTDPKGIIKDLFYYSGVSNFLLYLSLSRGYPKLLVLTYHRISPASNRDGYMGVPVDVFERHVKFIKSNFKTVSLIDGLELLDKSKDKKIYATVNLDDGYKDNYLYAYPILKKYNVPATVFLTTDFIGREHIFWWDRVSSIVSSLGSERIRVEIDSENLFFNLGSIRQRGEACDCINRILMTRNDSVISSLIEELEREYLISKKTKPAVMLNWEEINEMANNGPVSFGAHTKTHRNLSLLKDDEVRGELSGSKKEIEERTGKKVRSFSYPFGVYDERVRRLVMEAGFECARSTIKGLNQKYTDKFLLRSIGAGSISKESFLAARISANSLKE